MKTRLTFCGGAGTVTGANFLLETLPAQTGGKFLVDCGTLEQEHLSGGECDSANTAPFPYDVRSINALIVTHAHQDHIGRIPRLVREGFRGAIHSTSATRDISAIMFADALSVMQTHAEQSGCEVLYGPEDVEKALSLWNGHEYHEPFELGDLSVEFLDAGHILGSAMARFSRGGRTIVFTGDLGNTPEPLLRDTESVSGAEYVVMESVYGDRIHEGRAERTQALRAAVEDARAHKGTLLIPSFSVERTQVLLFELSNMIEDGSLQPIPVYLDSPLAIRVTDVFRKYPLLFNSAVREHIARGDDPFSFKGLSVIRQTNESHAIHRAPDPKVIIAGAGMSGGGRIRAHEKFYLGDRRTSVLFVGYQAPGTLGRRLQEGGGQVTIDGERIQVRARIASLTGYSGHADRDQLLGFIEDVGPSLKTAFITMGEPRASLHLAQRAHDFLGTHAIVPQKDESFEIEL